MAKSGTYKQAEMARELGVSQELDVHANSLYRWVQEVEEYGENAFPGNGTALLNL